MEYDLVYLRGDPDQEVVFVSCILHDLGLTDAYFRKDKPFEWVGANSARQWLTGKGWSRRRIDKVWLGILLHAGNVAEGAPAEVQLIQDGAGADVFGLGVEAIPQHFRTALTTAVPRLSFPDAFYNIIKNHVARTENPTWTSTFARSHRGR